LFKLLHVWPVVAQPTTVQQILDPGEQALAVTNVRPPYVELFAEGGQASEDSQTAQIVFHLTVSLWRASLKG
jgi:hypothetical protein